MSLPILAIIGQPNVGKSTLFNRLTKTRDALVSDFYGLTRDRQYASIYLDAHHQCQLIDTGGLTGDKNLINEHIQTQVYTALEEADLILFIVSAQDELNQLDRNIAHHLRKCEKTILLIANKSESKNSYSNQFYELGLGSPISIAAEHNIGIDQLKDNCIEQLNLLNYQPKPADKPIDNSTIISIIGRPNVGKSTLTNCFLNENRMLALDMPGTTRDSIYIPLKREGKSYTLIDTAGIRRKRSVKEKIETFSIIKAIEAIEKSHVVLLMLDAKKGITEQDAHLIGLVIEKNKSLVLIVNKWDGLSAYQKKEIARLIEVKLNFIDHQHIHYISAKHGSGVGLIFNSIAKNTQKIFENYPTSYLNKLLENASKKHQLPLIQGRRIRLKFINQTGNNPLTFVIHGSQSEATPASYQRYLQNFFKAELGLTNVPIILVFKNSNNPYKDKKNTLNKTQLQKKRRLIKFVKKH